MKNLLSMICPWSFLFWTVANVDENETELEPETGP